MNVRALITILGLALLAMVLNGCSGSGSTTVNLPPPANQGGGGTVVVAPPTLRSRNITPPQPSLAAQTTIQLRATGEFFDGSTQDLTNSVTWTSDTTRVATIASRGGMVTTRTAGQTVITARQGNVSTTTELTVTPATLVSIVVTPERSTLAQSTSLQMTATGVFSDGTTQDLTATVTWSTTSNVASVTNPGGLLTANVAGTTTVRAVQGAISAAAQVTVTNAVLESIIVSPSDSDVARNTSVQMQATGVFSDGTLQDLTATASWSSDDAAVSVNSPGGLATAVSSGGARITAAQNGVVGSALLTVSNAILTSVVVTPAGSSIAVGTSQQMVATAFTATGVFDDGSTQDLTATASWTSSATGVATITSPGGRADGLTVGPTTIRATQDGVTGSAVLNVTAATLESLVVLPGSASIVQGSIIQMQATGVFSDGSTQDLTGQVAWNATPAVLSVTNPGGRLTGLNSGSGSVTATLAGKSATSAITVVGVATLTSLEIAPVTPTIGQGTSLQFIATGRFTDGSTQDLTASVSWTSGTPTVATITSPGGRASAVTPGTTLITATQGALQASTQLTVTAARLESISISEDNFSLPVQEQVQFTATGHFTDGTNQDLTATVTWLSQNGNATITSPGGRATAVSLGSTTITASQSGVTASVPLIISNATITRITVTPADVTLATGGQTQQMRAVASFSDNTLLDVTATSLWTSSNVFGVVINAAGLATSQNIEAQSIIEALHRGVRGSALISVQGVKQIAVANFASDDVTILNSDGSNVSSVPTGNSPQAIAFGDGRFAVANGDSNTLRILSPLAPRCRFLPESGRSRWLSGTSSLPPRTSMAAA